MKCLMLMVVAVSGMSLAGIVGAAEKGRSETDAGRTVAYLGVATESVDPAVARHLKLRPGEGLEVRMVDDESPAAGQIREDDILKELNGQWLVNPEQLRTVVRMLKPGEVANITLIREGESKKVSLKLGSREVTREEEMREKMGRDMQGFSNEDMMPFFRQFHGQSPWGGMGRAPQLRGPEDEEEKDADQRVEKSKPPRESKSSTHVSSSTTFSENGRTVTLTDNDGDRQLKVTKDGKTEFEGPVSTEKQIDQLPKDIRELYEKVAKQGASIKLKTQVRGEKTGRIDI